MVWMVHPVIGVSQAPRVSPEQQVLQELAVQRVPPELVVQPVQRVCPVLRVRPESRVLRVHRDLMASREHLATRE